MSYYCAASNTKQGPCSKYMERQCIDCSQAEIDRLRAEVARLQTGLEQVEHVAMHSYREAFDLVSALLAETAPAKEE